MTANVSRPAVGATPSRHAGARTAVGLLGLVVLVLGVVLLFQPVAAARTLALLVGMSFIAGGLLEVAVGSAGSGGRRGSSVVLGAVLVVGGVLAIAWPGVTLWALALITGLSLIVHGAVRAGLAVVARHEVPGWGWLALAGGVNVVLGVLAIAWPQATVLVLSLVLGIQIAVFGLLLVLAAFWHPTAREAALA
ncbi:HdeD family acid-resistance protein [Blastococcus sp. SYSU D00695]